MRKMENWIDFRGISCISFRVCTYGINPVSLPEISQREWHVDFSSWCLVCKSLNKQTKSTWIQLTEERIDSWHREHPWYAYPSNLQFEIQKRTWIVVEIHSSQSRVNWLNHDTGKFNDSHPLEIIQNPKLEHHRNQIVQTTHFYFLIIQMILQVRPKRARTWSRKDDRYYIRL